MSLKTRVDNLTQKLPGTTSWWYYLSEKYDTHEALTKFVRFLIVDGYEICYMELCCSVKPLEGVIASCRMLRVHGSTWS